MDVQALVGATGAGTAAGAAPAPAQQPTPSLPQGEFHVLGDPPPHNPGIAPAIAKIFGSEGAPKEVPLNVSYKIEGHQIHTVFTDPATGEEIAQFPPDLLAHVAAFFDQQQGVTLDKNA